MTYKQYIINGCRADTAIYSGGGRREMHAVIHACAGDDFVKQLADVKHAAASVGAESGMTPVFKRYFLSDAANQSPLLGSDGECAVSVIQQPPLDGTKVALWIVFQEDADFREIEHGVWMDSRGRIIAGDGLPCSGEPHRATVNVLSELAGLLEKEGSSLADGCVRTWFMVRDVDRNYHGVVTGRNEEFARRGLTRDTHFISSTGIGGTPATAGDTIAFNACCDTRLKPGQMGFLYGSSHLNPTAEYGVAFERGTYTDYADRRKVYISGTASIDRTGAVVHPGDIRRQTYRMIENIGVLLSEAGCNWHDVAHLLVYLRDPADAAAVEAIWNEYAPSVPLVLLLAPVCRPGWLVESECMAIKACDNPKYDPF